MVGKLQGREATGPGVGPGTYDAETWKTIAREGSEALERSSAVQRGEQTAAHKLGFNARYQQHELPFEARHVQRNEHATPGPGKYEAYDPQSSQLVGHASRFKDTHVPDSLTGQYSPAIQFDMTADPTAYNPNHNREMSHSASHTFSEVAGVGKQGFGGCEPRELKLSNQATHPPVRGFHGDIEDTPGPGQYDPRQTETGREHDMITRNGAETMQSAVFASGVDRMRRSELPDTPGPGTYDPNFDSVEATLHDNFSRTGRDSNMVGKLQGREATGPGVGPGTYDPAMQKDGTRDTIGTRQEERDMFGGFGWNASFISDSLRTVFSGLFPSRPSTASQISI